MKKFVNKKTGVILAPNSAMVEEQLSKSPDYAVYAGGKAENQKSLDKLTVAELTERARAIGVVIPDGAKKAEIVELIKAAEKDQQSAGQE